MKYYIMGDGSYLGIIDVNTYKCHVGPNWANNPKLLEPHFVEQMQEYSGLFWDTNLETSWLVEVQTEKIDISGFREVSGSIKVTDGKLALLNYDSLTMLAQFEYQTIEEHIKDNFFDLENGNYQIRIVQLFDPKTYFPNGVSTDFVIDIQSIDVLLPPWNTVPWSKL